MLYFFLSTLLEVFDIEIVIDIDFVSKLIHLLFETSFHIKILYLLTIHVIWRIFFQVVCSSTPSVTPWWALRGALVILNSFINEWKYTLFWRSWCFLFAKQFLLTAIKCPKLLSTSLPILLGWDAACRESLLFMTVTCMKTKWLKML